MTKRETLIAKSFPKSRFPPVQKKPNQAKRRHNFFSVPFRFTTFRSISLQKNYGEKSHLHKRGCTPERGSRAFLRLREKW